MKKIISILILTLCPYMHTFSMEEIWGKENVLQKLQELHIQEDVPYNFKERLWGLEFSPKKKFAILMYYSHIGENALKSIYSVESRKKILDLINNTKRKFSSQENVIFTVETPNIDQSKERGRLFYLSSENATEIFCDEWDEVQCNIVYSPCNRYMVIRPTWSPENVIDIETGKVKKLPYHTKKVQFIGDTLQVIDDFDGKKTIYQLNTN